MNENNYISIQSKKKLRFNYLWHFPIIKQPKLFKIFQIYIYILDLMQNM